MINEKIVQKYKKVNKLDVQMNFLINSKDKEDLEKVAGNLGLNTSELLRILIKEQIKEGLDSTFLESEQEKNRIGDVKNGQ